MSFASIGIKTTIPVTAPASTAGSLTFSSIDPVNWLQITGDASAGSGSLYLLRWNPDLAEWRPYMQDKPIAVDSSALSGLFSGCFPFPAGDESFCLYDPAGAITATASAARTSSPLAAPAASSGGSSSVTVSDFGKGTATVSSVACVTAATLFASNSSAKRRYIFNPSGNGTLWVRLGSGSHTGFATSSFPVAAGTTWESVFPLDYSGVVQGILAAGSTSIQVTEVA